VVMKIQIFWIVTMCSHVIGYPDDQGSMVLQNSDILPHHYSVITHETMG